MARRLPKIVGYAAFFVAAFGFFLFVLFPVDRFTVAVEQQLSNKLGRKVEIESMHLSPFGTLKAANVEIEVPVAQVEEESAESVPAQGDSDGSAAKKAETKKPRYFIEEIAIDVGLLSLLWGNLDVELSMDVFGGEVQIAYDGPKPAPAARGPLRPPSARRRSSRPAASAENGEEVQDVQEPQDEEEVDVSSLSVEFEASDISLKQIHDLRNSLPVPIAGQLDLSLELESEDGQLSNADGELKVELRDVTLSTKGFKADMGGMQMDVPPLTIASAELHIVFVKGEGEVKSFKIDSKHFDAKLEGSFNLGDRPEAMRFDLYFMFKVLDAYVAQSDTLKTILPSLDSFSSKAQRAHRPDGYYGFRFRGPWRSATFQPSATFTSRKSGATRERSSRERRGSSRPTRPYGSNGNVGEPDIDVGDDQPNPSRPGRFEGAPPPMLSPPEPSYERPEPPSMDESPEIQVPPQMPSMPEPMMDEPMDEDPPPDEGPAEDAPAEDMPVEEAPIEEDGE